MSKVTDELRRMETDVTNPDMWTETEAEQWAAEYWRIRHDATMTDEQKKEALAAHDKLGKPVRKVHVNDLGNTVIRRFRSTERYRWDFDDDFRTEGWLQFDTDQDAWYFGVWVNPKTFRTFTYAEGDMTLVVCPDAEHYNAEIKHACEFYGQGFEFIACDMEGAAHLLIGAQPKGQIEVFRQNRSQFFAG